MDGTRTSCHYCRQQLTDTLNSPSLTYSRCRFSGVLNLVVIAMQLVDGSFLTLRIHSVNGHRWFWTVLILFLSCAAVPYNIAILTNTQFRSSRAIGAPIAHGCFEPNNVIREPSWNRCDHSSSNRKPR
ncbi:hypothetical protein BD311DRAFT_260202 [Dichomitus squalens]|uniref:Uncharacterized protein n=1 Tax=Dichomitus squalens TaxID=114155 RepID=A0A4Q9MTX8_9APHY|nr:hypothetical protein BD311DRAFT_260202 [Dichomitus squalens]